jgi:hypothetical protein
MKLDELKKEYESLRKKHNLPEFAELNRFFDIEKIDRETEFLLRFVRRVMMDKIVEQVRFLEMVLNPGNASPTFLQFIRKLSSAELSVIGGVYEKFVGLELDAMQAEIVYSEKNETSLITGIYNSWKKMAPNIESILGFMKRNFNEAPIKKEKTYFG